MPDNERSDPSDAEDRVATAAIIREAFVWTPRPDEGALIDEQSADWEQHDVRALLRGKRWEDVSVDDVRTLYVGVSMLSALAFRYYLPAICSRALILTRQIPPG